MMLDVPQQKLQQVLGSVGNACIVVELLNQIIAMPEKIQPADKLMKLPTLLLERARVVPSFSGTQIK